MKRSKTETKITKMSAWFLGVLSMGIFVSCVDSSGRPTSATSEVAAEIKMNDEGLALYDELLEAYIDEESLFVDYPGWVENDADVKAIEALVLALGDVDLTEASEEEKMAFYINAYNLVTLNLILTRYEDTLDGDTRSIRNIDGQGNEIWNVTKAKVAGEELSLNEIEHKRIRPMGDARIHFAVNCASKGCPPLQRKAFRAETLDSDLDTLASAFVNSGRKTSAIVDHDMESIDTSKILSWFKKDFETSYGSVDAFFEKFYQPQDDTDPETVSGYDIFYFPYDWRLNEIGEDDDNGGGGGGSGTEEGF